MLEQNLYDYITKFGYDEYSLDKFFEAKGWEYHYEITQTDLGPFAATYFTKDNYKFIIEFNHTSLDGYWIIIYFDILK